MRAVDRHHAGVLEAARAVAAGQEAEHPAAEMPTVAPAPAPASPSRAVAQSQHRRARRLERYQRVLELDGQGVSLRAIARRLGMHRGTVRRWLHAGSFPEHARRHATNGVDPFVDDLRRRWDEGCRNAARLTEEIRAPGFRGSYLMVRRRVALWRQGGSVSGQSSRPGPTVKRPSSRGSPGGC